MRRQELLFGLCLYAILLAVALIYWQGLRGPWLMDDMGNLGVLSMLDSPEVHWQDILTANRSGLLGRPVSMLSFIIDYQASGLSPGQFKYTNLLLHLLCTCLIFWLALEIGRNLDDGRMPIAAALLAAAFWAFSPLLVSTVLYAVQRMAQLSCLFTLAGLIAYARGRRICATRKWEGRLLMLSSLVPWLPLAALSKENGILLPSLLLCVEFFIFRFRTDPDTRRWLFGYFAIICAVPTLAAVAWLAFHPQMVLAGYGLRDFTLGQRLLTEPRVLADYVQQFLLPHGGRMGLYQDDFPISKGFLDPPSTLLKLLALSVSIVACFRAVSAAARALAFGWMFFLIGHLLESTIFSLEIYFEHRNYLPSVGLVTGIVLALDLGLQTSASRRNLLLASALMTTITAVASYQRISTWSDYDLLLESALEHHPNSSRLLSDVAVRRAQHGDLIPALKALARSLELTPSLRPAEPIARLALSCIAQAKGTADDYDFRPLPPDWQPRHAPIVFASAALGHLNALLTENACPGIDRKRLISGLNLLLGSMPTAHMKGNMDNWTLFFEAARTAILANDPESFTHHLQTAMTLDPTRSEAGASLIVYYLKQNRRDLALATFDIMASTNPAPDRHFAEALLRLKSLLWPQTD